MLTDANIKEIVNKIVADLNPLQVVLFGSYAKGTQRDESDLDLLVVTSGTQVDRDKMLQLEKQLISRHYSLDILYLTETDYKKKKAEGWRIFDEIKAYGRVLHAA